MTNDENIADILDDAAGWLESHTWCQGGVGNMEKGTACLVGSVNMMTWGDLHGPMLGLMLEEKCEYNRLHDLRSRALNSVQEVLKTDPEAQDMFGYVSAAIWNDRPSRTKQQVLDVLRKAAKFERGGPRE